MQIRQQPSVEDIKAEIIQQFGFIPPFFAPALSIPQLLENLWQQTCAYVNNPLPDIFKEQLAAYLSYNCHVSYCVIAHSCALHMQGITAREILTLLNTPLPDEGELERHLVTLRAEAAPLSHWPQRGSAVERALLTCAVHIFVQPGQATNSQHELEHLLGNERYQYLLAFFACIKTTHFWVESHPELSYTDNQFIEEHIHTLLHEEPAFALLFQDYAKRLEADDDITEHKQLKAMLQQTELLLIERARQLEAIFDAIADAVIVYDSEGRILQTNAAFRELAKLMPMPEHFYSHTVNERTKQFSYRDDQEQPIAAEQWPVNRILKGEVFKGTQAVDMIFATQEGTPLMYLSVSGTPIRDAEGHIIGGVAVTHDVTEQRKLTRRTHETLNALLAMAEALVQTNDATSDLAAATQSRPSTASIVGHRLAELTCSVLGCERVGISAVEPETEMVRAVAVVGLSPAQEQQWWIEQEQQAASLRDNPMPAMVAQLRANEILTIDMTQPPFNAAPNPYGIRTMLVAPMCVGNDLVGLLTLDYGRREHVYTQDEIALARAVARLGALVIERDRLLNESAQAQASILALRQANQRMDDFLSMASHELRTPLTSIKGNIQLAERRLNNLLQKEGKQNESLLNTLDPLQNMLVRANRQIKLLNRLVGDLLDVSRIEAHKLEMITAPFDLANMVKEIVQEQRRSHPNRTIELELPTESVPATGDADRIGQVVTNYLTNALKYSDAHKPVAVSLSVEGREARLRVRDQGPGLAPAERERVWERFYQAPTVEVVSGSGVGLGLGLHISKTIIEQHQGQVGVESVVDEGSTFWFSLPLDQEDDNEATEQ